MCLRRPALNTTGAPIGGNIDRRREELGHAGLLVTVDYARHPFALWLREFKDALTDQ